MEIILIVNDTPRVCIKKIANAIFPKGVVQKQRQGSHGGHRVHREY